MGPHMGMSDEPCERIRVPKRSTSETYSYGNFPSWRLTSVVRSGGGFFCRASHRQDVPCGFTPLAGFAPKSLRPSSWRAKPPPRKHSHGRSIEPAAVVRPGDDPVGRPFFRFVQKNLGQRIVEQRHAPSVNLQA
jgi:hypothetical protein